MTELCSFKTKRCKIRGKKDARTDKKMQKQIQNEAENVKFL
jgi:hypothetical protein